MSDDTPPDSGSQAQGWPSATRFIRRIAAQIASAVSGLSPQSDEIIGRSFRSYASTGQRRR
jgi:hypothetical protein